MEHRRTDRRDHRATLPYVAALDGLRGVAVGAVLLFHGGYLGGGYLGVDLFFVLSGFLITSLLLAEGAATGRIDLAGFWARRARRLLPAVAGLLLGVTLYCAVFATRDELAVVRGDAWATMLYVANWRAVLVDRDYWSLFRKPSPLHHTWSLAIEEQFYLLWPLLFMMLLRVRGRRTAAAALLASLMLVVASAAWAWVLYDPDDVSRVYYGTDTRAAAIVLGAALAAWLAWRHPVRSQWGRALLEIAGAAAMTFLAVAWSRLDGQSETLYRGGLIACGLAAAMVIAAAVHPRRGAINRLLSWSPLCLLGVISYGVYLWHWPLYVVLDESRTGLRGIPLLAVRIAVTLVIAVASYVLLERPIRRGAVRARQWRLLAPATTVCIVAAMLLSTRGALPDPGQVTDVWADPDDVAWATRADGDSGLTRVLVLGDSVAVTLFPGLERVAAAHGLEVVLGARVGCTRDGTPSRARGRPPRTDCPPAWTAQVARLRPDVVLLAESGIWTFRPIESGAGILRPGTSAWNEVWTARMQGTIDELIAAGARRVVLTTFACLRWRPLRNRVLVHANGTLTSIVARDPERLRLVDLAGYVCPDGRYQNGLGDVETLRFDGVHYSPDGSDLVGRWLAPQIADASPR